ncbi:MAG: hypothetical protein Q9227_007307 [Pyrenula ochraceoflavens]
MYISLTAGSIDTIQPAIILEELARMAKSLEDTSLSDWTLFQIVNNIFNATSTSLDNITWFIESEEIYHIIRSSKPRQPSPAPWRPDRDEGIFAGFPTARTPPVHLCLETPGSFTTRKPDEDTDFEAMCSDSDHTETPRWCRPFNHLHSKLTTTSSNKVAEPFGPGVYFDGIGLIRAPRGLTIEPFEYHDLESDKDEPVAGLFGKSFPSADTQSLPTSPSRSASLACPNNSESLRRSRWTQSEKDTCLKIFEDLSKKNAFRGDRFFEEAIKEMQAKGHDRNKNALKSFWTRAGKAKRRRRQGV